MGPNEKLDLKDTEKQSHFNNNEGKRNFETVDGFPTTYTNKGTHLGDL